MLEITASCNLQTANHGSGSCGLSNTGRPIVLDHHFQRYKAGTPDSYPFQNTIDDKFLSHLTIAPALSGLPPDPAPPLCLAVRPAKLAAPSLFSRGCFASAAVPACSAVCAPSPGGRGA